MCFNVWNETGRIFSEKEERAWVAAYAIEFIVIFLLNAFTLAIYTRNRHLRKPSTYLIINLTVADLMVGPVFGLPLIFETYNLESFPASIQVFSRWQLFVYLTVNGLFPVASVANFSLISFERLHATLFPFRHCLVGRRVYLTTIFCSWLFSLTLSSAFSLLTLRASPVFPYVFTSYFFLSLLILTVSYATIISTVKKNHPSPYAGPALARERKLTVTSFTVTVVSFLIILPWVIWIVIAHHIQSKLCHAVFFRMHKSFSALYFFNYIVNPLIYAVRMQEFRKAARKRFCTRTLELETNPWNLLHCKYVLKPYLLKKEHKKWRVPYKSSNKIAEIFLPRYLL